MCQRFPCGCRTCCIDFCRRSTGTDQYGVDAQFLGTEQRLVGFALVLEGADLYACLEMRVDSCPLQLFLQSLRICRRSEYACLDQIRPARRQAGFLRRTSIRRCLRQVQRPCSVQGPTSPKPRSISWPSSTQRSATMARLRQNNRLAQNTLTDVLVGISSAGQPG